jgi:tetratricopeptide (TPR) repeat protein
VLAFALAELGLCVAGQLYLAAYEQRVRDGVGTEGAGEVWAFGDSFTFGIGADDPATQSYPAVATRLASEGRAQPLSLVNLARPGLNSSEVVAELRTALHERPAAPAAILFLSGVNNWRWLGQSGYFCLDAREAEVAGPLDSVRVYRVLRWVVLRFRPPRDQDETCRRIGEGFQELERGRPDLALAAFETEMHAGRGGWSDIGRGLAHSRMGQHSDAVGAFEAARSEFPDKPAVLLALAWSRRLVGDPSAAEVVLEGGEPWQEYGDEAACLRGWIALDRGRLDEAEGHFRRAGQLDREGGPPSGAAIVPFALEGVAWVTLARGDREAALVAFDRCNEVGRQTHVVPHLLGWCHVGAAVVYAGEGRIPEAAAELTTAKADSAATGSAYALEGWLTAAGPKGCKGASLKWAAAVGRVPGHPWAARGMEACEGPDGIGSLDELWVNEPRASMSVPVVAQWLDPADTRLIETDIAEAAELARGVGAPLYLLQYPQPDAHPEIAAAVERAAAAHGLPVIDPRPRLAAELNAGKTWPDLFIPDGHPNVAGYRVVGEEVARYLVGEWPGG